MRTLTLSLTKEWFDKINSGFKKEEYREINEYWTKRLVINKFVDRCGNYEYFFNNYDNIIFTLGYPSKTNNERRLEFKKPKIRVDYGHAEWGAKMRKRYFVITWENT